MSIWVIYYYNVFRIKMLLKISWVVVLGVNVKKEVRILEVFLRGIKVWLF